MTKRILFVAQTQSVSGIFPHLKQAGYEAALADNLKSALRFIEKEKPLAVFSQPFLGNYKVEYVLAASRDNPDTFPPIIVFSSQGNADEAEKYLEWGASDYWLEPLQWEKIKAILPRPGETENRKPSPQKDEPYRIIGEHPAIKRVLALAKQVAPSKATVLISGESGTGKEMFARYIHVHSTRLNKPFIALNCAALPEHLLESELFGHEKGAFTGAINRKPGKFELADTGTILLDEISEMAMGLQAKLLRVLQEGEFDRVGGVETIKVDVRVIATTNRNLEQSIQAGEFRQDLYYRLNVIPLRLPSLREREADIMILAGYFAERFANAYGLKKPVFSERAVKYLTETSWPGNVRELQNLMERAVLLAGDGPIKVGHFLLESHPEGFGEDEDDSAVGEYGIADESEPITIAVSGEYEGEIIPLQEMERRLILKSLDKTSGNRTQAAELLGISVRTLRNKLNEYRIQGMNIP